MNIYLWNHFVCFAVDDVVLEHSKLLVESLRTPEADVKVVRDIGHNNRLATTPLLLEQLDVLIVEMVSQHQQPAVTEPEVGREL